MNAVLALQQVSLRCQTPDDVELRLFLDPESSQDDGGDIAHLESRTATSVQGVSGPDTAGIRTGRRRYNLCLIRRNPVLPCSLLKCPTCCL